MKATDDAWATTGSFYEENCTHRDLME